MDSPSEIAAALGATSLAETIDPLFRTIGGGASFGVAILCVWEASRMEPRWDRAAGWERLWGHSEAAWCCCMTSSTPGSIYAMLYLKSILFVAPIAFLGVWTIRAVQEATGFPNPVRDMLDFLLLVVILLANDQYGPAAAQREREGRR
jgi:hypothetical protein